MGRTLTEKAVLRRLRAECEKAGTQAAFAKRCGVGHSYVRRVLCGERPPCAAILSKLKIKRVVTYVEAV